MLLPGKVPFLHRLNYWSIFIITSYCLGCSPTGSPADDPQTAAAPTTAPTEDNAQASIVLNDDQREALNIETSMVSYSNERYPINIPGTVFPAPDNIALVSAPITGRVKRIFAHEGEPVSRGDALLELESLSFARLVSDYLQAAADKMYLQQQVERLTQLTDKKISPKSSLDKASAELLRAEAAERAVRSQLNILGVSESQLTAWQTGEAPRPLLLIRAPISGTIDEHLIDLGQAVSENDKMLSIINLDQLLVRGYLSPEDAGTVQPRDPVVINHPNLPERRLEAEISSINPALDEANKSIPLNIILRPSNGWPLPGQNVHIQVMVTPHSPVLSIPLTAIQYEGEKPNVFVLTAPETFEKREITLSRLNEETAFVSSGLYEGESVAITQVFNLKALSRFAQYGEE